ncbi:MAG: hypothetical protein C0448_14130 [Sphingobacteriaceae bacterium]|nr:hypothetical protein [Sphingobacteriaceae bacterium]
MNKKAICKIVIIAMILFSNSTKGQINPLNNFIGLDVSTQPQNASFNYDSCFILGKNLGMTRVGVFQNWTAIETSPTVYNMTIMDIANIYYPAYNMSVDLTITPIHTNNLEVPSDLTSTPFDNAVFINRFNRMLDSVKAHMPNVTLSSLVIGSEHDVYLGSNVALWTQYTNFYNAVLLHAKTLWPGLKVATELTFNGITTQNTFAQTLNTNSDYIGVSYYPLNTNFTVKPVSVISTDFATLVGLYASKPICFYQYGYPSSSTCNSSDVLQAQFISQTFTSWDTYASNIKMIDFTWLHDLDMALVNYYGTYYGLTDPVFLEYLHTLGMRNWNGNGSDKLAFTELKCQAKQRGYNALPINCSTSLSEINTSDEIVLFPNPVQTIFSLQSSQELNNATITVFNSIGQVVKTISNVNAKQLSIDMSGMPNGLYLVEIHSGEKQLNKKIVLDR